VIASPALVCRPWLLAWAFCPPNGGWYFENDLFTKPLHGHPLHAGTAQTLQSDGCYRSFVGDLIPFRDRLRAAIEHGGWNEDPVDIESLAFYYRSPRPSLFQTDSLDVGNAASEAAHGYANAGQVWSGETNAPYEGNGDGIQMTDDGRWIGLGGSTSFTVHTDPPGAYVVLRRRLNCGVPRQEGDVYVGGTFAGTWYDAGSNAADGSRNTSYPAFRDSEFFIAPALARGKTSLTIGIVNASGESEWTEYAYWACVVHDGSTTPADFDYDGAVDQEDFGWLQGCLSGALTSPSDPLCRSASLGGDPDVDEADVTLFLACLSGCNIPAEPGCADR